MFSKCLAWVRTIAFAKSRVGELSTATPPTGWVRLARLISPYRARYTIRERREIEDGSSVSSC